MREDLARELIRNSTGYYLSLLGVLCVLLGAHFHIEKLIEAGSGSLLSAALLAFQARRSSDPPVPTTPAAQ